MAARSSSAGASAGERFCRGLAQEGDTAWRLPSIGELAELYDADAESSCGDAVCRVEAPFRLTSPYHWSATPAGADRRFYFDFRHGTRLSPRLRPELTRRVLCVRSTGSAFQGE